MFQDLPENEDPQRILAVFTHTTLKILQHACYREYFETIEGCEVRIADEHLFMLQAAFEEMGNAGLIDQMFTSIEDADEARLIEHGLTGHQLAVKIQSVKHREGRFLNRPVNGMFRRFIDAIDNLLESLIDAIGVGGAIKEFKDALASLTD